MPMAYTSGTEWKRTTHRAAYSNFFLLISANWCNEKIYSDLIKSLSGWQVAIFSEKKKLLKIWNENILSIEVFLLLFEKVCVLFVWHESPSIQHSKLKWYIYIGMCMHVSRSVLCLTIVWVNEQPTDRPNERIKRRLCVYLSRYRNKTTEEKKNKKKYWYLPSFRVCATVYRVYTCNNIHTHTERTRVRMRDR